MGFRDIPYTPIQVEGSSTWIDVSMLCYALLPLLLTPTSQMILPVVDNLFTVNHAIDYLRQGNYVFDSVFVCWQHQ